MRTFLLSLLLTVTLSISLVFAQQPTFPSINSLPYRNTPASNDSIPLQTAAGTLMRTTFDKFGGGGSGTGDALKSLGLGQFAATPSADLKAVINDENGSDPAAKVIFALGTLNIDATKTLNVVKNLTLDSDGLASRTLNVGTGGTLQPVAFSGLLADLTDAATVVRTNAAATYSAGAKQTFVPSATTSGSRLLPVASDPSVALEGDFWWSSSSHRWRVQTNAGPKSLATTEDTGAGSSEQTVGDVNLTWTAGKTTVRQTAALTANRTGALPAANSFPPGFAILYYDSQSSATSTFGRVFSPTGFDTLNGSGSSVTPFIGNGNARFVTNGVDSWVILDTRNTIQSIQDPTDPTKQLHFVLSGLGTGKDAAFTVAPCTLGDFLTFDSDGDLVCATPSATSGISSFSAGDLSPFFTTTESLVSGAQSLTFNISNAGASTILGNAGGTSGPPSYLTATQARAVIQVQQQLSTTAVKTGNYNAGQNEINPADITAGSFQINLPNAPPDGTRQVVKLIATNGTNVLTIACQGSDVFNKTGGATTGTLSLLNQALAVQYRASGAIWYVVSDDLPLSQLDARYQHARSTSITSSATPLNGISTDSYDAFSITALATNVTSMTTGLTGTPVNFDQFVIRIKDDGTPRTIVWGASYASRGATLPTTTTASKVIMVSLVWNSATSTWDCVGVTTEA